MMTKVLIVEDEVLIAREIEDTLQELGYKIAAVVHDGEAALQKVVETKPDLVLMDIVIPGEMDGIETAELIRTRFKIPVVYLSAYADKGTIQRVQITQPFGYLLKPFHPQTLNITLKVALTRHQVEQQKLTALQNNLSSSLPHEINTPLHSILGFTDFLLKSYNTLSKQEALELIQCVQSAALRLERTSQNFLLHARLQLLAVNPEQLAKWKQQDFGASAWSINQAVLRKAKEFDRAADLKLTIANGCLNIMETYLIKVVEELVDNALKFSELGTIVEVVGSIHQDQYQLVVSDLGRGMTPEQITSVDAYLQFDRSSYEQQGLGLGLTLVKQLVNLYDGKLEIESTLEQGTRCKVLLPLCLD